VQAKVAVHPFEQGVIDVGLGCVFARRVRFARPQLEHLSGSLDAGVRFCHHRLRQALAAPRYILQLAEQPRDVGDLLIDTGPSSKTPGSALGPTTGRRIVVIEARALEIVVDREIDDFRSHKICTPGEYNLKKVLLFNETRGGSGRPGWPGCSCGFLVTLNTYL
jgi:hypothetical protein